MPHVEGKKVRNAVNGHRGNEPGIVSVPAHDPVCRNKPLPFGKDSRRVSKEWEERLDADQLRRCLGR